MGIAKNLGNGAKAKNKKHEHLKRFEGGKVGTRIALQVEAFEVPFKKMEEKMINSFPKGQPWTAADAPAIKNQELFEVFQTVLEKWSFLS